MYSENMAKKPKRPRDPVQLAKFIGDIATGQTFEDKPSLKKGAKGGLKGGKARAKALGPKKRREIARKGASARWAKKPSQD